MSTLDDFPSAMKVEPVYTFDDPEFFKNPFCNIIHGDCIEGIKKLPDLCLDSVIFSPPYWRLRSYNIEGQIGQEKDPREYINKLVEMCRCLRFKLKSTGTVFINIGDSYFGRNYGGGPSSTERKKGKKWSDPSRKYVTNPYRDTVHLPWLKRKQLLLIPSRLAIALQDDGWTLRNDIMWLKKSSQPFSGKDRLQNKYEHIFFFVKKPKYYFDLDSVRVPRAEISIRRAYSTEHLERRKAKGNEPGAISGKSMVKACAKLREKYDTQRITDRYKGKLETKHDVLNACIELDLHPYDRCPMCGEEFGSHRDSFCKVKGVNPGDVIHASNKGYKGAHFAVYSEELITPLIKMGSPVNGVILDPFLRSGTTALTSRQLGRNVIGIDLNREYIEMSRKRISEAGYNVKVYEV